MIFDCIAIEAILVKYLMILGLDVKPYFKQTLGLTTAIYCTNMPIAREGLRGLDPLCY